MVQDTDIVMLAENRVLAFTRRQNQ